MTRPLRASIPHSLGKEEARRRIQGGFANVPKGMLPAMFGLVAFTERWEQDRCHFEGGALGQKVTGRLDVEADTIAIEVDLPEFLAALADQIRSVLTKGTQKLLEKSK